MQYPAIVTGAAVLLALAPSALAAGTAHVINKCGFPVYYASVSQNNAAAMQELPIEGYSEDFNLPNVGVSIKIATSLDEKPTQFEYTWAGGKINWDLSNIDGNPFLLHGMQASPTLTDDPANPTCKNVTCIPGLAPCLQAYNAPNDVRTMVCDQASNLTLTLCPTLDDAAISAASVLIKRRQERFHARQLKF